MSTHARSFNPVLFIAAGTRRLQAHQSRRPLKGLTHFMNWLHRWLPAYQGVIRLANGAQMEVDSHQKTERWLLFAGDYQPALTNVLRHHTRPGAYCMDLGANLGFYTVQLAQWTGPTGRVVAFEANPAMAARVRRNVALNHFDNVTLIERPVHASIEPVSFTIMTDPGKSSIHASGSSPQALETLALEATTIDATLDQSGWQRLDVIKIDIEGNDCNALLGGRQSLAHFRPFIVFEYWYSTPPEVARSAFDLLDSLGYTLRGLLPNGREVPFDWLNPAGQEARRHIDIIAEPSR